MSLLQHLNGFSEVLFRWILQTTWQAAVLATLIGVVQRCLGHRLSAAWRYRLWLLLVVRLLMPTLPPSVFSVFNLPRAVPATGFAAAKAESSPYVAVNWFNGTPTMIPSAAASTEPDLFTIPSGVTLRPPPKVFDWFMASYWVWLAGVAFLSLRLVWTNLRFGARLRRYQPVNNARALRLFAECRCLTGISAPIDLIESEEVDSPAVYGLGQKRLLLQEGVFERFSDSELRHIFLHELAHIKRGDLTVNWLAAGLRVLHWFNPVLWLAWARMRADRELATDAMALAYARENDPASYGETILKVVEGLATHRPLSGMVGIVEDKARLKERLLAIRRPSKSWTWAAVAVLALLAAVGLTRAQTETAASAKTSKNTPQLHGKITGTYRDYDGPIPHARLRLMFATNAASFKTEAEVTADQFGHFIFDMVPIGAWTLTQSNQVSKETGPIGLRAGETLTIEAGDQAQPFSISSDRPACLCGTLLEPSGKPAARAQVMVLRAGWGFSLAGDPVLFNRAFGHPMEERREAKTLWSFCTTDDEGHFFLNDLSGAWGFTAASESGFIRIPINDLTTEPTQDPNASSFADNRVRLEGWGRIEGTAWNYEKPLQNEPVAAVSALGPETQDWSTFKAKTDEQGHFSFDFVPPGQFDVNLGAREPRIAASLARANLVRPSDPFTFMIPAMEEGVTVKQGETASLRIGGGRPVIGKFRLLESNMQIDWSSPSNFYFVSGLPGDAIPHFKTDEEYNLWRSQQPIKHFRRFRCAKDGSFRIEQVPPGTYELMGGIQDPKHRNQFLGGLSAKDRILRIPSAQPADKQPYDLGFIYFHLNENENHVDQY